MNILPKSGQDAVTTQSPYLRPGPRNRPVGTITIAQRHAVMEKAGEFEIDQVCKALVERRLDQPQSTVFLLTYTFKPSWFANDKRNGNVGALRTELVSQFAPTIFDRFRGWWIGGLKSYFPQFHRPSQRPLQPVCYAYIDDKHEGISYPHIHAVCWCPNRFLEGLAKWSLQPRPSVEVHLAPPVGDADLRSVVAYASKYVRRRWMDENGTVLKAQFPDC